MGSAFKSYDIRGRLGVDLDASVMRQIGRAFADVMQPKTVVLGYDARETSPQLANAIAKGLCEQGVDVIDIGMCGTEEVYFATDHFGADGGLMVTASHNPIDYNGVKLVGRGAVPISRAGGLDEIETAVDNGVFRDETAQGQVTRRDPRAAFAARVLSFVETGAMRALRIVVNAGNGAAGTSFDEIAKGLAHTPLQFERLFHDADFTFPNGIPNPLLPENRHATAKHVRETGADFGVAWDGDFDRCFLFDETGKFVDGEYVVGLLAQVFLGKETGAKIVHDPRIILNTQDIVSARGGQTIPSKTGHALVKAKMREVDAVYGGEMSAHHYFREFMYCDSGMIPWLLVAEHLSRTGKTLGQTVETMRQRFPSSGEINFRIKDADKVIEAFETQFGAVGTLEKLDGVSLSFPRWRVNLRSSNTEPLLRLNIETHGDQELLRTKLAEISQFIEGFSGTRL